MPDDAGPKDLLYYYSVLGLFGAYKAKKIKKKEAANIKKSIICYLDTLEALAHSNSKIVHELDIMTAPRAELVHKDKAELLNIISTIEAVVTGLVKEHSQELPEFLRIEEQIT
jgi:hypothetical protein